MNKGLVTKVEKDYFLVMTDKMTIERLKEREGVCVGDRIEFDIEDQYKGIGVKTPVVLMLVLGTVFILMTSILLVTSQGGHKHLYASVSVDINPSIELDIDNKFHVIAVKTFNDDACLLSTDGLLGLSIDQAMVEVIDQARVAGFLDKNSQILIGSIIYANDSKALEYNIDHLLATQNEDFQFAYVKEQSSVDRIDENRGMSFGRTYVMKAQEASTPSDVSVKVLFEMLEEGTIEEVILYH